MYEYGIGGQEVPKDASEAIADIPKNRTLMIEKLTQDAPLKPVIAEGLKTVEEVFQHFRPVVGVELQKDDGSSVTEELSFGNLGDFGAKGIVRQSKLLQEMNLEVNEYAKFIRQLKSNKLMKSVIGSPDAKEAFIDALRTLAREIGEAG